MSLRPFRHLPFLSAALLVTLAGSSACQDSAAAQRVADSIRTAVADSIRADSIRQAVLDSTRVADSLARVDSARAAADLKAGRPASRRVTAADSARWPVKGLTTLPGAILPEHRVVAFYGNPLSKRMGILGEIPPDEMMAKLEREVETWRKADPETKVLPALHMIATVAQGNGGPEKKYRLRMSDSVIERVAGWAERKQWLMFIDIQPGLSTVKAELPPLMKYLERPYMHLAIDPEFAMTGRGDGALPGKKIGTVNADDINWVIDRVAHLVDSLDLPPKMLVVHRFTYDMVKGSSRIKKDPRVQVIIDMDGWGPPSLKRKVYQMLVTRQPVQYSGFKLFYKNDKPMMKPADVLELFPRPHYIQYQ